MADDGRREKGYQKDTKMRPPDGCPGFIMIWWASQKYHKI